MRPLRRRVEGAIDRYREPRSIDLERCYRTPDAEIRQAIRVLAQRPAPEQQARAELKLLDAADELDSLRRIVRWNLRHAPDVIDQRRAAVAARGSGSGAAELPVIHTERWTKRGA